MAESLERGKMLIGFDIAKHMLEKVEVIAKPELKAVVISTMFALTGAEVDPVTQLCYVEAQQRALDEVFPLLPSYDKIVVSFDGEPGRQAWEDRMQSGCESCMEDIVKPILSGTHLWSSRLNRMKRGVKERKVPFDTFALITIYYSIRELNARDISYDFGWIASLVSHPLDEEEQVLATTSIEKTRPLRGAK